MTPLRAGLLTLALAGAACEAPPSSPRPTDQSLIERFDEAAFERLVREPNDAALRERFGVLEVRVLGEGHALLVVWQHDYVGPGGAVKGYARSPVAPGPLVEDLDAHADQPGQQVLHRRLTGAWYLYYASTD